MMTATDSIDAVDAKPRRRATAKASTRPAVEKVKLTLVVDLDTSERLAIYATKTRQHRSDVVAKLVKEHLRRFVVQDRGGCDTGVIGEGGTAA